MTLEEKAEHEDDPKITQSIPYHSGTSTRKALYEIAGMYPLLAYQIETAETRYQFNNRKAWKRNCNALRQHSVSHTTYTVHRVQIGMIDATITILRERIIFSN